MGATGPAAPPGTPRPAAAGTLIERVERLLCLLDHHVPDDSVIWHQGYGFARCRRCGQAIVRSLLSGWTVPGPGLRIVWYRGATSPDVPAGAPRPGTADRAVARGDAVGTAAPHLPDAAAVEPAGEPMVSRSGADQPPPETVTVAAGEAIPLPALVPLISVAEPGQSPVDLLGPHFMGDKGAPPGPSEGLSVFEFDDMTDENDAMPGAGAIAQGAR